jgi:branched-chain amino acid transport system permease protein
MTTIVRNPRFATGIRTDRPRRPSWWWLVLLVVVAFLVAAPEVGVSGIGMLPGPVNNPGSLQVLGTVLAVTGLAVSFDVLMGYTGLVSFGHGMFFALGAYSFVLTLAYTPLNFPEAVLAALGIGVAGGIIVNGIALKTTRIAYSMITLAVAQLLAVVISEGYLDSGGTDGVVVPADKVPAMYVGILNTKNAYWTALVVTVIVIALCTWVTGTKYGRVWQGIRENELRASVLGYNTYAYKLAASVFGSLMASVCGIAYALVLGIADPSVTSLDFSIGLVIMLVLGGRGRIWGAVTGAVVYEMLELRLPTLSGVSGVASLPAGLKIPLSQPEVLLGAIFIIFVLFLPNGLAGLPARLSQARRRGSPGELASASGSAAGSPPVSGVGRSGPSLRSVTGPTDTPSIGASSPERYASPQNRRLAAPQLRYRNLSWTTRTAGTSWSFSAC